MRDFKSVLDGKPARIILREDYIDVVTDNHIKGETRWRFSTDLEPVSLQLGNKGAATTRLYHFRRSGEHIYVATEKKGEAISDEVKLTPADLASKNDSNFYTFGKALQALNSIPEKSLLPTELKTKITAACQAAGIAGQSR